MSKLYEIVRLKTESAKTPAPPESVAGAEPITEDQIPSGVDRRKFLMRSAVIGAAAVMTGRRVSAEERISKAASESLLPQQPTAPPLDKNLNVVKKGQGFVMTTIDEFYKVGP